MAAVNWKRSVSVVVLAILVFAFVVVPGGTGLVMADGVSGGHPVQPPPPDSTQDCIQPSPELDPVCETTLLVSGLSMMLL